MVCGCTLESFGADSVPHGLNCKLGIAECCKFRRQPGFRRLPVEYQVVQVEQHRQAEMADLRVDLREVLERRWRSSVSVPRADSRQVFDDARETIGVERHKIR